MGLLVLFKLTAFLEFLVYVIFDVVLHICTLVVVLTCFTSYLLIYRIFVVVSIVVKFREFIVTFRNVLRNRKSLKKFVIHVLSTSIMFLAM